MMELELQPRIEKENLVKTEVLKNPFKDNKDEFPVDDLQNEIEVLGRYDAIIRAFVLRGYFKLYEVLLFEFLCCMFFILQDFYLFYVYFRVK